MQDFNYRSRKGAAFYHATSHKGVYIANKYPKSLKFLFWSVFVKLQAEYQQLKTYIQIMRNYTIAIHELLLKKKKKYKL